MKALATFFVSLILASSTVFACINDKELIQHEREFRSQYLTPQMTSTSPRLRPKSMLGHYAVRIGGVAMLGIAFGSVWKRSRG